MVDATSPTIEIFVGVAITVIGAGLIGVVNYVRNRLHCIDVVADRTKKTEERTLRQSKAMILMSQIIDTKNDSKNPTSPIDLAEKVESLLKDEEGNL